MPTLLQASISSVPAGAVTFLPSTVMFTSAIRIVVRYWSFRRWLNRHVSCVANDARPTTQISKLRPVRLRQLFQTGTACLPNDPRTLFEISLRWKSSASPQRRPADRRCVPAYFPKDIGCYRYLFLPHRRGETE